MKNKPIFSMTEDENSYRSSMNKEMNKFSTVKADRKMRFDKKHPMRFPVTKEEAVSFTRFYKIDKEYLQGHRENLTITDYLSMMLRFGLRNQELIDHDILYKDTGEYRTVKPNQVEHDMIASPNGLALQWEIIYERRALHRIMISVLHYRQRGGRLVYEEVQPIRPTK
jgi:hypothetical protein